MRWHDKPSVKGNIQSGSQSEQIRVLILSPGRSPRSPSFPTASKTGVPDTPSVLAFRRCAWYFLLFNILVGRFPELTPVCSQTTKLWLLPWMPVTQPDYDRDFVIHTDTLAYGVGAILLQEGEIPPNIKTTKPLLHPIAYYSASFIQA